MDSLEQVNLRKKKSISGCRSQRWLNRHGCPLRTVKYLKMIQRLWLHPVNLLNTTKLILLMLLLFLFRCVHGEAEVNLSVFPEDLSVHLF